MHSEELSGFFVQHAHAVLYIQVTGNRNIGHRDALLHNNKLGVSLHVSVSRLRRVAWRGVAVSFVQRTVGARRLRGRHGRVGPNRAYS